MSLVINISGPARMLSSTPTQSQHTSVAKTSSAEDPEIKVSLREDLAKDAKEAAASTYNVTSLKALKARFYKSPIG